MADPSIERFRRVIRAAGAYLDERRQEVNDLNVFPVADGDTGDNMALTLKAVSEELDRLDGQPVDEIGRTEIVNALAPAGTGGGSRAGAGASPRGAPPAPPADTRPHHEDSRFRYCTNFIVTAAGLEGRSFASGLEELGDSVLVVGDEATLKVHVHTDEPETAMALFAGSGE